MKEKLKKIGAFMLNLVANHLFLILAAAALAFDEWALAFFYTTAAIYFKLDNIKESLSLNLSQPEIVINLPKNEPEIARSIQ